MSKSSLFIEHLVGTLLFSPVYTQELTTKNYKSRNNILAIYMY